MKPTTTDKDGGKRMDTTYLTKIHREHTCSEYRNVEMGETEEMGMAEGIT